MKNILSIVKRDINNIAKNRAALIVIAALIFLPSLYAWFNIKASWDPYSNTEGVTVAVASLDEGATVKDKEVNIGDEVIVNLTENEDLGWIFVSEEEAVKGVEHGDYYAAIIIPENFSEKLVSVSTNDIEKPELDYYINEKINAISPKVTKTGASAIVENIHTSFLKEANETVISVFNTIGLELEHNYVDIEKARDALFRLEDEMPNIYANLKMLDKNLNLANVAVETVENSLDRVDKFHGRAQQLNSQLVRRLETNESAVEQVVKSITNNLVSTQQTINDIPKLTENISKKGNEDLDKLISSLYDRQNKISDAGDRLQEIHYYLQQQDSNLKESTKLKEFNDSLDESKKELQQLISNLNEIIRDLKTGNHPGVTIIERTNEIIRSMDNRLESLQNTYESFIIPQMESFIEQAEQLSTSMSDTIGKLGSLNEKALQYIQQLIENEDSNLGELRDRIENISALIDSNLIKVNATVWVLEAISEHSDSDRIANLLTHFKSLQTKLSTAQEIVNNISKIIGDGEEPDESLVARLEGLLGEVNDKIIDIQNEFDEAAKNEINNVVTQLKHVNNRLTEQFNQLKETQSTIKDLSSELEQTIRNPERTISALEGIVNRIDKGVSHIDSIQGGLNNVQKLIDSDFLTNEIDRILVIREELLKTNESIDNVIKRIQDVKKVGSERLRDVDNLASNMNQSIEEVIQFVNGRLLSNYKVIVQDATNSLRDISDVLKDVDDKLPTIRDALTKTDEGIEKGKEKIAIANNHFPEAQDTVNRLANKIRDLEEKGDLDQLISLLTTDPVKVSEFLAEPILLNELELYPIPNYGSAMNPFYTTLALWVGGLLLISSLKVDIVDKKEFKSYEVYGGRLLTFLGIGVLQSLIVTLGNIFLLNAYIVNKFSYVLFGILISVTFMTIIYTLVSVFGNTGKVIAIILLVMQLGGSGGTFPIQMAPPFFQKIYNFVPFTHAISLLRESIGGILWDVAWKHIIFLIIYFVLSLALGIGLKKTINKSSDKFTEKARESEIVI